MNRPPVSVGSLRGIAEARIRRSKSGGTLPRGEPDGSDRADPAHPARAVDEATSARPAATLRDQIARLERELATVAIAAYPRLTADPGLPCALAGPRVLSLGELERVRDALAGRLSDAARRPPPRRAARQADAARELERMLADPPAHKWRRLVERRPRAARLQRPTTSARAPACSGC